jgi:hypothetical protein
MNYRAINKLFSFLVYCRSIISHSLEPLSFRYCFFAFSSHQSWQRGKKHGDAIILESNFSEKSSVQWWCTLRRELFLLNGHNFSDRPDATNTTTPWPLEALCCSLEIEKLFNHLIRNKKQNSPNFSFLVLFFSCRYYCGHFWIESFSNQNIFELS